MPDGIVEIGTQEMLLETTGFGTATTRTRMAKRERPTRKPKRQAPADPAPVRDDQNVQAAPSLHQLFEQQARQMLDRTDLGEEQKQQILVAMSCPCCGAGAMSYTVKLKR